MSVIKFRPNDAVIQISTNKHFTFLSATDTDAKVKDSAGAESQIVLTDLRAAQ